ncbi:MAG TPA: archease [Dissulfurispiraceae bacterium]|nr:archease [Dissulfurispiraceae bacterium]
MDYEQIDISGDVGIRAWGRDCAEAWANAGIGMFSLVTDLSKIGNNRLVEIAIKADSSEGLLVRYLNELIFHLDTYNFIGNRIDIVAFSEDSLRAFVYGAEFDPSLHEQRLLLKAATYHNIRIAKMAEQCVVEVIFDI